MDYTQPEGNLQEISKRELQCFHSETQDKHCISDSLRFVRMIKPLGDLNKRLHGAAQVAGFAIADR